MKTWKIVTYVGIFIRWYKRKITVSRVVVVSENTLFTKWVAARKKKKKNDNNEKILPFLKSLPGRIYVNLLSLGKFTWLTTTPTIRGENVPCVCVCVRTTTKVHNNSKILYKTSRRPNRGTISAENAVLVLTMSTHCCRS